MKKIYLFEFYYINPKNGTWSLYKNFRVGLYDKRKELADLKRKGYVYNRKEKAYIQEPEPTEGQGDRAVMVKSYEI